MDDTLIKYDLKGVRFVPHLEMTAANIVKGKTQVNLTP